MVGETFRAMTSTERTLFFLAVINFVAFCAMTVVLGGDALNGTSVDGHYFLNSHGKYTEVSRGVFEYSYAHAVSLLVTHPLGLVAAIRARIRASHIPRLPKRPKFGFEWKADISHANQC